MTTVILDNKRFTTIYILKIHPTKDDSAIATSTVHRRIFDSIIKIDDTAVIVTLDQVRFTRSKKIPSKAEYNKTFKDCRTCKITKCVCVSFKLESTHIVSQLKYGSLLNRYKYIFDALRENLAFMKMNKFKSHTDVSIGFS